MINYSTIYWLTRLDYINKFFVISTVLCSIWVLVLIIGSLCEHHQDGTKQFDPSKLHWFTSIASLIFFASGVILIPKTSEAAAMIVVPAIANNEDIHEIGESLVDLAKEWVIELSPSKQ